MDYISDSIIKSRQNTVIKLIKSLENKKNRDLNNLFIIENHRFVRDIPLDYEIEFFAVSQSFYEKNDLEVYTNRATTHILSDELFGYISSTETAQGILAAVKQRMFNLEDYIGLEDCFFVVLDRLSDPGNIGTVIRCVDAAGVTAVILTKESADVYNPKIVRATAGSIFNIPIITRIDEAMLIKELKNNDIAVLSACLTDSKSLYETSLTGKIAVFIGNEAHGLSDEIIKNSDARINIPILGRAESINAAVAAGIIIYEGIRQRSVSSCQTKN